MRRNVGGGAGIGVSTAGVGGTTYLAEFARGAEAVDAEVISALAGCAVDVAVPAW